MNVLLTDENCLLQYVFVGFEVILLKTVDQFYLHKPTVPS